MGFRERATIQILQNPHPSHSRKLRNVQQGTQRHITTHLKQLLAVINDENTGVRKPAEKTQEQREYRKPAREREIRGNTQPLQGKPSGS